MFGFGGNKTKSKPRKKSGWKAIEQECEEEVAQEIRYMTTQTGKQIEAPASLPVPTGVFSPIIGYEPEKQLFYMALDSDKPVHILLNGPPGTGKTMFLQMIDNKFENSFFTVGSNTSKAGLIAVLMEQMPHYILIDELEKMKPSDQVALLHVMETGIISQTMVKGTDRKQLNAYVFAACNSTEGIIAPLLSRFLVKDIPEYTYDQFKNIAIRRLTREENLSEKYAESIAFKCWNVLKSNDFRDCVKMSRLAKNEQELDFVIETIKK